METTQLSNKRQMVIPEYDRTVHGWRPGLEFAVEDTGDGISLKPMMQYLETKAKELLERKSGTTIKLGFYKQIYV